MIKNQREGTLRATRTTFLNGRAFNIAIGTINAAISDMRFEYRATPFAIIEILASISEHSVL